NPSRDQAKVARFLLNRSHEQNRERYKEAPDYQQRAQRPPRFSVSGDKELGLLRNVRIPDEHVLTESDVGPENCEGQHPFSHDVIISRRNDLLKKPTPPQARDNKDEQ